MISSTKYTVHGSDSCALISGTKKVLLSVCIFNNVHQLI